MSRFYNTAGDWPAIVDALGQLDKVLSHVTVLFQTPRYKPQLALEASSLKLQG
jgi:hypothetical protein